MGTFTFSNDMGMSQKKDNKGTPAETIRARGVGWQMCDCKPDTLIIAENQNSASYAEQSNSN